eukprot:92828_1
MKKFKLVILAICIAFFGGVPIVSADWEQDLLDADYETPIKAYVKEKFDLGWDSAKINSHTETSDLLKDLKDKFYRWNLKDSAFIGFEGAEKMSNDIVTD